jgi:hypothetical protein
MRAISRLSSVPRPTLSQQFYIFTNDAVYPAGGTIRYTLVNMNVAGNSTPPAPPLAMWTAE